MYKIIVEKSAEKFIRRQPKNIQQRLYDAIKQLPYGTNIKRLTGYKRKYRLRVGAFRVVYNKYDDIYVIEIVDIDNRGQVYKNI